MTRTAHSRDEQRFPGDARGVSRDGSRPVEAGAVADRAVGAIAFGAVAMGALAVGALAVGALAVGALAVGRLAIGRARIRHLEIDDLVVRNLRVTGDLRAPSMLESEPRRNSTGKE